MGKPPSLPLTIPSFFTNLTFICVYIYVMCMQGFVSMDRQRAA